MIWPYIKILVLQVDYSGDWYYNPHSTVESIWSEHFSHHKMAKLPVFYGFWTFFSGENSNWHTVMHCIHFLSLQYLQINVSYYFNQERKGKSFINGFHTKRQCFSFTNPKLPLNCKCLANFAVPLDNVKNTLHNLNDSFWNELNITETVNKHNVSEIVGNALATFWNLITWIYWSIVQYMNSLFMPHTMTIHQQR